MSRRGKAAAVGAVICAAAFLGFRSTGPNGYSVWYCYESRLVAWAHSARWCPPAEPAPPAPVEWDDGEPCRITDNPDGSVKTDWRGEAICN